MRKAAEQVQKAFEKKDLNKLADLCSYPVVVSFKSGELAELIDLMMMELPEDSELYDSASEIYEASAKAKEIIQQISSLSRKNMETAYKNLNAAKIFRRALKMVQSVCPVNIKLTDELELSQECFLGNETQMNQVILNICVNAIHAIGHQEGTIKVSGRTAQAGELKQYGLSSVPGDWRQYIRLDISDNGCGMPDEILKQIFDRSFVRAKKILLHGPVLPVLTGIC